MSTKVAGSGFVWDKSGVPQRGWSVIEVYDNGAADHVCQMCGNEEVRYVHVMSHPDHPDVQVGCVCAVNMSADYAYPRETQEVLVGNAHKRTALIHSPLWRRTFKGNLRITRFGLTHVVFRSPWGIKFLSYDEQGGKVFSEAFPTEEKAVHALAEFLYPSRIVNRTSRPIIPR